MIALRRTPFKASNLLAWALLVAAATAGAQMSPNMAMPKTASAPSAAASALTEGVVQNVDKSYGLVTLNHRDIVNMGMPAMTMAFNVADKKIGHWNATPTLRVSCDDAAPTKHV